MRHLSPLSITGQWRYQHTVAWRGRTLVSLSDLSGERNEFPFKALAVLYSANLCGVRVGSRPPTRSFSRSPSPAHSSRFYTHLSLGEFTSTQGCSNCLQGLDQVCLYNITFEEYGFYRILITRGRTTDCACHMTSFGTHTRLLPLGRGTREWSAPIELIVCRQTTIRARSSKRIPDC